MRAEFFREDAPDEVIGSATWDGRGAHVERAAPEAKALVHQRRRLWEGLVGRGRRHDEKVDVVGHETGILDGSR